MPSLPCDYVSISPHFDTQQEVANITSKKANGVFRSFSPGFDRPSNQVFSPLPRPDHGFPVATPSSESLKSDSKQEVSRLPPKELSSCIRQLSELSIELFDHSLTVPPQSIHQLNPHPIDFDESPKSYSGFKLDDTFHLSQKLIDIYPILFKTSTRRKSTKLPKASYHWSGESSRNTPDDPQVFIDTFPSSTLRLAPPLDQASILLLLSCHTPTHGYLRRIVHAHRCLHSSKRSSLHTRTNRSHSSTGEDWFLRATSVYCCADAGPIVGPALLAALGSRLGTNECLASD